MDKKSWEKSISAFSEARERFYSSLGCLEADVIAPIVSYSLQGFPAWPVREAWRIIRRPSSVLIVSDGLSDPWEDGSEPSGLEAAVELDGDPGDFGAIVSSWPYQLLFQASFTIIHTVGLRERLLTRPFWTMEFGNISAPEAYLNEHNRVGAIVKPGGYEVPEKMDLPEGDALLLVFTPVTAVELGGLLSGDREGVYQTLQQGLAQLGLYHRCAGGRRSLL